jgi:oleate hydratase
MSTMKAYFIGGGIGSLAGAAFLIRDGGIEGSDITIFEKHLPFGGSLDGARLPMAPTRCAAAAC